MIAIANKTQDVLRELYTIENKKHNFKYNTLGSPQAVQSHQYLYSY